MAIVSHRHRIVFFPIAKNGSSSVKHFFYELETGSEFREAKAQHGLVGHVHRYYPTRKNEQWEAIYRPYDSVAIVRDPIKRFLSAYSNRVVHKRVFETVGETEGLILADGEELRPTLDQFVDNLEFYCKVSPYIRNHIAPQAKSIGHFFPKIKHVYDIADMPKFEALLSNRLGRKVVLPREQSEGEKFYIDELTEAQLRKLVRFYRNDYQLLSKFYEPPKGLDIPAAPKPVSAAPKQVELAPKPLIARALRRGRRTLFGS